MSGHIVSPKFYVGIWAALMLLTGLTAGLSRVDLGVANAIVAMIIAATKATLVFVFFMHMKWSDKVSRVAGLCGIFFVGLMIFLTCAEFFTRYGMIYPNR